MAQAIREMVRLFCSMTEVFVVQSPDNYANLNMEMLNFIQMLAKMNGMTTFESFGGARPVCARRGLYS